MSNHWKFDEHVRIEMQATSRKAWLANVELKRASQAHLACHAHVARRSHRRLRAPRVAVAMKTHARRRRQVQVDVPTCSLRQATKIPQRLSAAQRNVFVADGGRQLRTAPTEENGRREVDHWETMYQLREALSTTKASSSRSFMTVALHVEPSSKLAATTLKSQLQISHAERITAARNVNEWKKKETQYDQQSIDE